MVLLDNLGTILLQPEVFQSPPLLVEQTGNRFLVEVTLQQQSRPMELFGSGVVIITGNLEQIMRQAEVLQSPHLPVEITGNKLLVDDFIRQQLKPMELCGVGVVIMKDNLETILPHKEIFQSPHLPEEPTGNRFLVDDNIPQQLKLMGLYGLGVRIILGNLGTILPHKEIFQSPHLPVETIGNLLLVDMILHQQLKLMGLYGLGVVIVTEHLELMIQTIELLQSQHLPVERIGNLLIVDKHQ